MILYVKYTCILFPPRSKSHPQRRGSLRTVPPPLWLRPAARVEMRLLHVELYMLELLRGARCVFRLVGVSVSQRNSYLVHLERQAFRADSYAFISETRP